MLILTCTGIDIPRIRFFLKNEFGVMSARAKVVSSSRPASIKLVPQLGDLQVLDLRTTLARVCNVLCSCVAIYLAVERCLHTGMVDVLMFTCGCRLPPT
eukprot:9491478-Pyramimonas_sp.AAC.1